MAKRIRRPDEVYDDEGRQRFHGAFTGGFSAGYFNTVGSREGWKPRTATDRTKQSIEDFMDDDDVLDARIHAPFRPKQRVGDEEKPDMLVELIRVDDLIGQKLLAKLGRRQIIKSSIVLPKLSNLSRRGLGFEPDKRLQSAKKASLQEFYRPDDEYEVYDAAATSSRGEHYHTEIIDPDDHDDDHEQPTNHNSSFLSKLDQYANHLHHSTTSGTTTGHQDAAAALPGFRMDSADASVASNTIKRFPGPDVPMATFIVSAQTFPIELSDAEIQLRHDHRNLQHPIIGVVDDVIPSPTSTSTCSAAAAAGQPVQVNFRSAQQFHKVAQEMRNRFTVSSASAAASSSTPNNKKGVEDDKEQLLQDDLNQKFVPKRVVTVFHPANMKLLCRRFDVPFTFNPKNKQSAGVAADIGKNASALDQVLTSALQQEQQHQRGVTTNAAAAKDVDQTVHDVKEEAVHRPAMDLFKSIFEQPDDDDEDEDDESLSDENENNNNRDPNGLLSRRKKEGHDDDHPPIMNSSNGYSGDDDPRSESASALPLPMSNVVVAAGEQQRSAMIQIDKGDGSAFENRKQYSHVVEIEGKQTMDNSNDRRRRKRDRSDRGRARRHEDRHSRCSYSSSDDDDDNDDRRRRRRKKKRHKQKEHKKRSRKQHKKNSSRRKYSTDDDGSECT